MVQVTNSGDTNKDDDKWKNLNKEAGGRKIRNVKEEIAEVEKTCFGNWDF